MHSDSTRLLFFSGGSYVAGLEIINLELMRKLKEFGIPVHAVISGWNDGMFPTMLDSAQIPYSPIKLGAIIRGNPLKVPLSWTINGLRNAPSGLLALSNLCKEFRATHLIHVEYQYAFVVIAALGSRYRHVLHAHEAIGKNLARFRGRYVVKRCSSLVCVSDFVREGILQSYPKCAAKVVHNGCRPITLIDRLQGKRSGSTVFGIVGQVSPHKNIELTVRAINKVRQSGMDCKLMVFGNDDNDYARRIKSKGYSGIKWMGFYEDRSRIYAEIDCLISACSYEPFGTTIIEAMSAGLAVIACGGGGPKELVTHERTGLLFEPDDEEGLIRCLLRMLDPTVVEQYGKCGREHFNRKMSIEAMAHNFLNALA